MTYFIHYVLPLPCSLLLCKVMSCGTFLEKCNLFKLNLNNLSFDRQQIFQFLLCTKGIRIRKVHLVTASLSQYQCLDQIVHLVQLSYGH